MHARPNARLIRIVLGSMMLLALLLVLTLPAAAQCPDTPGDSSCITCHESQYPVYGLGEWHDIHARKDCCWNCHGGNSQAEQADLAHAGMLENPLADVYTDCYACHPADYQERAARFGAILGIEPGGSEPPGGPASAGPPVAGWSPRPELQLVILPTPQPQTAPVQSLAPEVFWFLSVGAALLALLLAGRWLIRQAPNGAG